MTTLGTSGGATATNPGALTYHTGASATSTCSSSTARRRPRNNGGVILRSGDQVAILDNGTAATRSGAILGLAPTPSAQAKPCASGTRST